MIQANCRTRFTAADFDFIVRTLSKSPQENVSLVTLLTDHETRDQLLDDDGLGRAILAENGHLAISPHLLFYVLARRVLREAGLSDRRLCDYIGSLLAEFSQTHQLHAPVGGGVAGRGPLAYLSDLLLAMQSARSPEQVFFLRAHVGNTALFLTGIFHENIARRSRRRGAPDCSFYEEMGRSSFRAVAGHAVARRCELSDVFEGLAEQFRAVRLALNELADRLLNLGDDAHAGPLLASLG